jgi:hypothetical protein
MGSFKLLSFCAMLFMATNLYAVDALVDDCEGGTNQNKFGYYWYMYDDSKDLGNSKLSNGTLTVAKSGTDYVVTPTAGAGNGGTAGIVLPFTLGPTPDKDKINYVGVGTMLCDSASTSSIDLTGATSVTFYIKADAATVVDFAVLTKEVTDFAYYHQTVPVTTAWQKVTVALGTGLGGLAQPVWSKLPVPFNLKSVTKLQWQMHTDNVTNPTGVIYLDDIYITNYTYVPFDMAPATMIGAPGLTPTGALLSNMDTKPYNQNARGFYWYCYNDGANRTPAVTSSSQYSAITAGATPDLTDPLAPPIITIGPGGYNSTNGADIQFSLGPTFNKTAGDGVSIKPFVGVGTALWNEKTSSAVYNASADGATGIYFDYMLSTSASATSPSVLRLEVTANAFTKDGVVHYINLPATGAGVWKSANIPFNKLVLPKWDGVPQGQLLDATILKKLQWAVQDNAGVTGELSIDNVYLIGATKITPATAGSIKLQNNSFKAMSGISTSFSNNNLKVSFAKEMSNASITLVNTQGSVVKNLSGVSQAAQMNLSGLANGVYMLSVKATLKSGAAFNQSVPVTIY